MEEDFLPDTQVLNHDELATFQEEFDLPPTSDQTQNIFVNNELENPKEKNLNRKNFSNLPISDDFKDSAEPVKNLFDKYFIENISLPASEVDAVVTYFQKRGFGNVAASNVASVLLQQAKLDNVKVFALLDTLKGVTDVELSRVVAQILNVNRSKISSLGFRVTDERNQHNKRNIRI